MMALLLGTALAAEGEVWTSAEVEYDASDVVELAVEQHLRLAATPFGTAEVLTDLGGSVELHEHLELAAAYRVGFVDVGDAPESRHRLAFDVSLPTRVGAWKLSLRQRYQVRIGTGHNSEAHVLRTRVAARLKRDGVEPYVSTEPFVDVARGGLTLSRWRTTAGLSIPLGDQEVSLFYRMDVAMPWTDDETLHIVGVAFEFEIPR